MGKLSRLKMLGANYRDRVKNKAGEFLGGAYNAHSGKIFPYSEEDNEGVITWESPRKCKMLFKGITVDEGYKKTVDGYRKAHISRSVNISIDGLYVVVQF